MIYYLQSGPDGPVKIGFTTAHVGSRIISMQATSPHKLTFLGSHVGARKDEHELHALFADYQFRGEWFHPVRPIFDHISATSDGNSLDLLLRNDLRAALKISNRKNWKREDKVAYEEQFFGYGNPLTYRMFSWMNGSSAPTKEIEEKVSAFLRDRGLSQ